MIFCILKSSEYRNCGVCVGGVEGGGINVEQLRQFAMLGITEAMVNQLLDELKNITCF